ncbi:hypothetical protein [Oleiharenicola lentus]|uniref:hypothetical protein n=1 Tax=Oleiharenicola lentus TaxID=2508720 RepID=UPI003F66C2A9
MSKRNTVEERQELHDTQTDCMQGLLFTLKELGEQSAFLQMEFDGVMHFCVARKITQTEFDALMQSVFSKN